MKVLKLIIAILVFSFANGQNNKIPLLTECNNQENSLSCSYFTIHNLILSKLNSLDVNSFKNKPSEIIISSLLRFDENGKVDSSNSLFYSKEIEVSKKLNDILTQIKTAIPSANKKGENIASYYRNTFYFSLKENGFETWNNTSPKEKDFFMPEKYPIFSGCKEKWPNERLRKCMSLGIARYVKSEFNSNGRIKESGILPGSQVKISVFFKINPQGKIINVGARAKNKILEDEAIRVIKNLNDLTPGYIAHKPVTVPISLPILLLISY
ncbi:hypothetical protein DFQ05_1267 [Winogradskyella wandonensis]|uniref:TonB-like protein n=1 Tax=Winogradskyella wandonensis TaxID=1442586 RepID=A0A4V6NEM7_9FLAO|nr:hypothetical protein [Winogradskyella wandonensis]TCK67491.1 hypothetical protein DFQ05_1267 [Winogradskyella wandonensis]